VRHIEELTFVKTQHEAVLRIADNPGDADALSHSYACMTTYRGIVETDKAVRRRLSDRGLMARRSSNSASSKT
jgi:hypothetical protein